MLRWACLAVVVDRDPSANRARDQDGCHRRLSGDADTRGPADARRSGGSLYRRARGPGHQRLQQRQGQQHAGTVAQRPPCPEDRLAGGTAAQSQGGGDLVVAQSFQLAHHDCRPLGLRQRMQAAHQVRKFFAPFDRLLRAGATRDCLGQRLGRLRMVAQLVQRRVADDAEEPGAQLNFLAVAAQRQQRLRKGVLGDVLGAPPDDCRGVASERLAIAAHDLLESVLVALADELDEAAVRLCAQGRTDDEAGGEPICWRWHLLDSPFGLLI